MMSDHLTKLSCLPIYLDTAAPALTHELHPFLFVPNIVFRIIPTHRKHINLVPNFHQIHELCHLHLPDMLYSGYQHSAEPWHRYRRRRYKISHFFVLNAVWRPPGWWILCVARRARFPITPLTSSAKGPWFTEFRRG